MLVHYAVTGLNRKAGSGINEVQLNDFLADIFGPTFGKHGQADRQRFRTGRFLGSRLDRIR